MKSIDKFRFSIVDAALQSPGEASENRLLASKIKAQWRSTRTPNFKAALEKFPALRQCKSLVLDLAFEEYCLLSESGRSVDPEKFVQDYPSINHSLFRMIDVYQYYQKHVNLFGAEEKFQWPSPGDSLFDFTVIEELGRGALARVYLCTEDKVGQRQVVVKLARGGAYEAATLGKLSHPNIVPIYSVLENSETQKSGICMPFRGRSTLCDVLDCAFSGGKPATQVDVILEAATRSTQTTDRYDGLEPTPRQLQRGSYIDGVSTIGIQLASALEHSHQRRIIHADLKPSNVLLSPTGTALLLDFNLSVNDAVAGSMTGGTLPYMSPERIQSVVFQRPLEEASNQASDVFSLGIILYELLAGKLPFQPESIDLPSEIIAEQLLEQQQAGCVSLQKLNPHVDRFLSEIVEACLNYTPVLRPSSMGDVERLLRAHQSTRSKCFRWARLHKFAVSTALSIAAIVVAVAITFHALRDPEFVRNYNQGMGLFADQQYQQAIDVFDAVVALEPFHADAYHMRGRARLAVGQYQSALSDFQKAYSIDASGQNAVGIAFSFSKLRNHSSASVWYRRALNSGFETPATLNNLGYAYIKTRKFPEAEQVLLHAAEMGASPATVSLNRARLALDRADTYNTEVPDHALADIEQAISLDAKAKFLHTIAATLYGLASLRDERYSQNVIEHLQKAHESGIDLRTLGLKDGPAFTRVRNLPEVVKLLNAPLPDRKVTPPNHMLLPWDDGTTVASRLCP